MKTTPARRYRAEPFLGPGHLFRFPGELIHEPSEPPLVPREPIDEPSEPAPDLARFRGRAGPDGAAIG